MGAVPRIEPAPPLPDGNAVTNGLLARVLRRRPDLVEARVIALR